MQFNSYFMMRQVYLGTNGVYLQSEKSKLLGNIIVIPTLKIELQ